jgi:serine/threonine-protein kinase
MGATRVGKTLGNFRILECLGSGGSGMIWKAEDLSLGRIVALKALRPELAADGEMSQRFRDEARTLAKLSHPNVASLYSLIEDEDGLFLVLEYVEGHTLAALLATSGPLPVENAFALFHQVLDGIAHAHEAGIVHRDLKPSNLMVDARGRVKVMDFGIARVTGAARTTHHGKLVGTPEYMSPEQVRGEDATIRSDVYSLGILLYEMLTGQPPFRSAASFELMRAQIEDPPPDPRALRPELSAGVAAAILRALEKRPIDRFATTRGLHDALIAAGASHRAPAPVWRDAPWTSAASEAPTLAHADTPASAGAPAPPPAPAPATPAEASGSEPQEDWERAVGALEEDIDAALARASAEARAKAPATIVLDVTQDTAHMEPARPTRMIDDAPFAAHAKTLGAGAPASRARGRALLWALASAALVAVALGAVRIREGDAPGSPTETGPAKAADAPHPSHAVPRAPVTEVQPPAAELAQPPAPAPAPSADAARRAAKKPAAQRRTKPAPQSKSHGGESEEESGWVIRR